MVSVLTACGGGGGGAAPTNVAGDSGESLTPLTLTYKDLAGEYFLFGTIVKFEDGRLFSLDQNDSDITGRMTITESGAMTQKLSSLSFGFSVVGEGTFRILKDDLLELKTQGCTANVPIELKHVEAGGRVLSTTMPMRACGQDFEEIDVWYTGQSAQGRIAARRFKEVQDYPSEASVKIGGGVAELFSPQY